MKAYDIYKNFFLSFIFLIFIFGMSIDYFSEVYTKVTAPVTEEKVIYTEEFEKLNPTINSETNTKLSLIGKYKKTWKDFSSALTASPTDLTINKFVLTVNTHFCNTAGMSYIPGTTFIKLDNGTLLSTGNDSFNSQKMDTQMNYLNNFMQTLKEKSINYVYIDCPNKDEILGDKRPLGFRSTSKKEEKEYMFKSFEVNDIPSLRLGEKMIQTENDANNMFYKTDHHWKTEFGIDAAFHIAEYLNTEFDYKIDTKIFNRSNYTPVTYEDCLLGSTGINSTIYFTEAEDYQIWYPNTEFEYSFVIPSKKISKTGNFDIFINMENINKKDNWPINAYGSYLYSNSPYLKIENKSTDDSHKILIIKDSYSHIIVPYLSQVIGRIDVIDIRTIRGINFKDNVTSLIEENNYDTVLFIYNEFPYEFDRLYLK